MRTAALLGLLAVASAAPAADGPAYSPYTGAARPSRVFFGDTHLHTSFSTDAGMVGNRLGPAAAYRFARGETIVSSTGVPARLVRPLDFLVVTDHAEQLGIAPLIVEGSPVVTATELGRQLVELVRSGDLGKAHELWQRSKREGTNAQLYNEDTLRTAWGRITAAAEKYNDPGRFSALIGFEWTLAPGGRNLHRNVIFRGGKAVADQVLPLAAEADGNPEQLWDWMEQVESRTGSRLLAIAHNGNLSNGLMFAEVVGSDRRPMDRAYAERRSRWEPIYEVTQIKGDGETHPLLSPNDEFANFERWDKGGFGIEAKTPAMLPAEYAREALKRGLALEAKLGINPFKLGLIGSTDSHTSLATTREENFFGKATALEPSARPERLNEKIASRFNNPEGKDIAHRAWQSSAAGLAAVWAAENTREALFDAMARREVYATTGTRMVVRLFAGWDFTAADLESSDFAARGYARGVPMGGGLTQAPAGKAPVFLVQAMRDADGANLDRVQMVKGWLDADGRTHERVYDIAWSGKRKPGRDGTLPPVGNTVDVAAATYENSIGAPYLAAHWRDPAFDPRQRAFYYVRVLEIPTPRWTTYDARVFGTKIPEGAPASIQERAYTSPVWYSP
jgi:hypothetical protein